MSSTGDRGRARCVRVLAVRCGGDGGVGDGVVRALVSLSTEALRLVGPKSRPDELPSSPPAEAPSSMAEFVEKLEEDFRRMYFVTGDLADELYVSDCVFADPTISFEGLELYKNNLRWLMLQLRLSYLLHLPQLLIQTP